MSSLSRKPFFLLPPPPKKKKNSHLNLFLSCMEMQLLLPHKLSTDYLDKSSQPVCHTIFIFHRECILLTACNILRYNTYKIPSMSWDINIKITVLEGSVAQHIVMRQVYEGADVTEAMDVRKLMTILKITTKTIFKSF
jgi:hypothetical protein